MAKVTSIESGKKPPESCQFCGKQPPCPDWTCERLAAVTVDTDGSWTVEFVQDEPPYIECQLPTDDPPSAA